MALYAWWYEDEAREVRSAPGLTVEVVEEDGLIAAMAALPVEEIARRRSEGHRSYVARIDGQPAAYGWVASRQAEIGELSLRIELPQGHRYLWDFCTLPTFRGRGIYPQLLAEIVRRECPPATRLWIIHAPENLPSGTGISRAGFSPVAELSFDHNGRPALTPKGTEDRADAASRLLGLPLVDEDLDPCWGCGGDCCCDHSKSPANGGCSCAIVPGR